MPIESPLSIRVLGPPHLGRIRARTLALGVAALSACAPPTRAPNGNATEPAASMRAGEPVLASSAASAAAERAACPDDMVPIEGDYCHDLEENCVRPRRPWQCAEFAAPTRCVGRTSHLRYCIDRYEYPNRAGERARVMVSWNDAQKACEALGKRLCTEDEWTLACEGPERLPFPYGYARDASACNIDKPSPQVDEARLFAPDTQRAELERLDQREPSGARTRCASAFGVFDLTGNVDEWVKNPSGTPYRSSLKGGNWGEWRNACRPVTRGHGEPFYYYQIGFRCCRARDDG